MGTVNHVSFAEVVIITSIQNCGDNFVTITSIQL